MPGGREGKKAKGGAFIYIIRCFVHFFKRFHHHSFLIILYRNVPIRSSAATVPRTFHGNGKFKMPVACSIIKPPSI